MMIRRVGAQLKNKMSQLTQNGGVLSNPDGEQRADKNYVIQNLIAAKPNRQIIISQTHRSMQQNPCLNEFSMRSTMPSSFNRMSIKSTLEELQRIEKSQLDNTLNPSHNHENPSNSFFVRISKASLDQQKRIYKWRMNCGDHFVGITSLKLQSEGNCYNPNLLFKVDLSIWKSNFVQVKDLCLTKCVNLLKSVLRGLLTLLEYFDPILFTEKMIYQTEEGFAKIWLDERFYINPNNELYCKNTREISVQQSLRSVVDIFQLKCLKTKLSAKLFSQLSKITSIKDAIWAIDSFEHQENLFPIQGLKVSVSTGTALNTSCSLEFSASKSVKKRKMTFKVENEKEPRVKNIASHKFLQAKSMEININFFNQIKKQKELKLTYQSQNEIAEKEDEVAQPSSRPNAFLLEVNPEKPGASLVISEMFNSDNDISRDIKKQGEHHNSIKINSNIIKGDAKFLQSHIIQSDHSPRAPPTLASEPISPIAKKNTNSLEDPESSQFEHENIKTIISRNGWSSNLTSLFERRNVKHSMCEGKEQNLHLKDFKLKKLNTMGKEVRESILPVDQEADDY